MAASWLAGSREGLDAREGRVRTQPFRVLGLHGGGLIGAPATAAVPRLERTTGESAGLRGFCVKDRTWSSPGQEGIRHGCESGWRTEAAGWRPGRHGRITVVRACYSIVWIYNRGSTETTTIHSSRPPASRSGAMGTTIARVGPTTPKPYGAKLPTQHAPVGLRPLLIHMPPLPSEPLTCPPSRVTDALTGRGAGPSRHRNADLPGGLS
jgi:hypothetical protein